MQFASAFFIAACQATGNQPLTYLEISWDGMGSIAAARGSAHWTDETAYLVAHRGALKIEPPGENMVMAGDIANVTIELANTTQRFSWLRTDKPLYANIGGAVGLSGKLVRLWQGLIVTVVDPFLGPTLESQYVCIFTGVIADFTPDTAAGNVELECRDIGWLYLQQKVSTVAAYDVAVDAWIGQVCALGHAGVIATGAMDAGIYPLPFAWLDDESLVDEIWQAAEADCGLAYFDQLGRLRFENALHWLSHLSSVWTFNESHYGKVVPAISTDAVATKVTVEWSGRVIGSEIAVYTLDNAKRIMPGATLTWQARFSNAVSEIYAPSVVKPFNDYTASGFGGDNLTADVTVTLSNISAQQCTVTVLNNNISKVALITFLQLRGLPLIGGPTEQESALAVPAPYSFERVRSVRGNPYVQTQAQGQAAAGLLAVRGRRIRPVWRLSDVPGVPQLELGDRVSLYDQRNIGPTPAACIVIGISWEGSKERGFVQELDLIDYTDLWAYDDYYIIGVTALGTHGRAYY